MAVRSMSASTVARTTTQFNTWSSYQGCEQVAFSDIPKELKQVVEVVFDVDGRIPAAWTDESSSLASTLIIASPEFFSFLKAARKSQPSLFSPSPDISRDPYLFSDLQAVFLAWKRLKTMRKSRQKWSEADYVANVYSVLRSPAIHHSTLRSQSGIALPEPLRNPKGIAARTLSPRSIIPDCSVFLSASQLRPLARTRRSPFNVLNSHPSIRKSTEMSTFPRQCTPHFHPPEIPGFEFASAFLEDKKSASDVMLYAYRQNRMASAAGVRHLHSFRINAPVFGLVWGDGIVKAHVDWWVEENGRPSVLSAPYPGHDREAYGFHEWDLESPSEILEIYLLLSNIDQWTSEGFRGRVISSVEELAKAVLQDGEQFKPWRKLEDGTKNLSKTGKENTRVHVEKVKRRAPSKEGRKRKG